MKNKIINIVFFILFSSLMFASENIKVTASTSWTRAFAELAGVDDVKVIAPANMKHPPEYEVTVSDILTISNSDYFIYAGFERMMKTLADSVGNVKMIKIKCDNSIETVKENALLISKIMGTEKESEKRVNEYITVIENGRKKVEEKGMKNAKVLCHKHQVYLAKELGFEVKGVFGPEPVTSKQILDAKNNDYDLIIDNVHNTVGEPLKEVSENSRYIVWRNFPEENGKNSLMGVVQNNIEKLFSY